MARADRVTALLLAAGVAAAAGAGASAQALAPGFHLANFSSVSSPCTSWHTGAGQYFLPCVQAGVLLAVDASGNMVISSRAQASDTGPTCYQLVGLPTAPGSGSWVAQDTIYGSRHAFFPLRLGCKMRRPGPGRCPREVHSPRAAHARSFNVSISAAGLSLLPSSHRTCYANFTLPPPASPYYSDPLGAAGSLSFRYTSGICPARARHAARARPPAGARTVGTRERRRESATPSSNHVRLMCPRRRDGAADPWRAGWRFAGRLMPHLGLLFHRRRLG